MELTPLAPRARLLFYLQTFAGLFLFWAPASAVAAAMFATVVGITTAVVTALVVFFLLFLVAIWWPSLAFERWGYTVREQDLVIRNGVLIRRLTTIPLGRIQHVDTRQGPIEQWLG